MADGKIKGIRMKILRLLLWLLVLSMGDTINYPGNHCHPI
jgi:hypothetical protein